MASTVAKYLVSEPRFLSLTWVWCSTECAFVKTLLPATINPLLLELYCFFLCHGSEKFGSVWTQKTLTTASIDGTTFTAFSHCGGSKGGGSTTTEPVRTQSPFWLASRRELRRSGNLSLLSVFLGRPGRRRWESGSLVLAASLGVLETEAAPFWEPWGMVSSSSSSVAGLGFRPRFLLFSVLPIFYFLPFGEKECCVWVWEYVDSVWEVRKKSLGFCGGQGCMDMCPFPSLPMTQAEGGRGRGVVVG